MSNSLTNYDAESTNLETDKLNLYNPRLVNNYSSPANCDLEDKLLRADGAVPEVVQDQSELTQAETNSLDVSTDVDEEEDDINSFMDHEDQIVSKSEIPNEKHAELQNSGGISPDSSVEHVMREDFKLLPRADENDLSNFEEEKIISLSEDGFQSSNNALRAVDYDQDDSLQYGQAEKDVIERKDSPLVVSESADESTNFDGEKNSSKSSDCFQFNKSRDFSGFTDNKNDASDSNDDTPLVKSEDELSICNGEAKKKVSENGFSAVNCDDTGVKKEGEVQEKRAFVGFGTQDLSSGSGGKTVDNEQSQDVPNGVQSSCGEELLLSRRGAINADLRVEERLGSQGEDSRGTASELHQQNSQDVTSSVPDLDKEDSLTHWSDGDSSPGRLQIDAEFLPEPAKSDDDVDPSALTIDTGEPAEVKPEPAAQDVPVLEPSPASAVCTNLDQTIENVATGNVSPTKLDVTKPLKRQRTTKRFRRAATGSRLVQNNGKTVQKWHISSMLKCPRCPMSSFSTVSALLEHQRGCGSRSMAPPPAVSGEQIPKMPRKVYMCSACGSYFENWNLFVHMKEMHKRHMCLYCLGMFSQAGKLAQHLSMKHQIRDQAFLSGDELSARYPGPHFLLCCRCDRMCTDKDFESHSCSSVCSHCGLAGTHYPTCRLAPQVPPKPPRAPRRRSRAPKKVKEQPPQETVAPPPLSFHQPPQIQPPSELPIAHQDLRSPAEELSPTTFNERMLQLYRANKPVERNLSSMDSIEETINRVVEESAAAAKEEMFEMEASKDPDPEVLKEPSPAPMEEDNVETDPGDENEVMQADDTPIEAHEDSNNHSEGDTSDSEKLTIALDPGGAGGGWEKAEEHEGAMVFAGEETPYSSVPLSEPLNVARVPIAMKLFVRSTSLTCVYCAHARKIAVNGKQLALHLLAQHRYITVAESASISDRDTSHATVVRCLREALPTLDLVYFNAYGYDSADKSAWRSSDRVYECFHCCYSTPDSKEFLSHNRKIHQNASHLCIMCKTRFLTYSELLCHLCGGVYIPGRIMDPHLQYRCYACDCEPLPSSFQLMVHLRRLHTACDMCFVMCESQTALFTHVQKHKFLFYCYACALTYRTRQEMTKHIFWKHGAESVTCKRCLQKKWKHAYHFCLPPVGFSCEECAGWFKTSSALRVHKRLHQNDYPHACTQCDEKFISRKLLAKHAIKHEPPPPPPMNGSVASPPPVERSKKKEKKKKKEVADLFDLPPVNLSESDDSSEDEKPMEKIKPEPEPASGETAILSHLEDEKPVTAETSATAMDSAVSGTMWDGVLAGLEGEKGRAYPRNTPFFNLPLHRIAAIMLADHDYCRPVTTAAEGSRAAADHDYCNNGIISSNNIGDKRSPRKTSKRRTRSSSSDSSSSSSSSCSCGSNCSCSSSSSSTESATSGEPRPPRRKLKESKTGKNKSGEDGYHKRDVDVEQSIDVVEGNIQESDLDTDEPVTDDDDFYEKNPALRASEVLRKNRSLLLDKLETSQHLSHSPMSHKSSSKKKKSRSSPAYMASPNSHTPRHLDVEEYEDSPSTPGGRRPRRKRVPLKYYGFSSGEEDDLPHAPNAPPRKKERIVEHNTTIPAPPPPPAAPPSPEPSNLWNPPSWRPPPVPPKVNPIKIRTGSLKQTFAKSVDSGEFTITRADLGGFHVNGAPSEGRSGEKLYCFCQCPYDEVSEMIACDAVDCRIEWFHFECVGIMVPPKGKWFCPECKKKAAAESEMMGLPLRPA